MKEGQRDRKQATWQWRESLNFRRHGISLMIKTQQTLRDPCGLPREPLGNSFISLKKDNTVILGTIPFNYRQKNIYYSWGGRNY